jgi:prophage maintenance system killer protein
MTTRKGTKNKEQSTKHYIENERSSFIFTQETYDIDFFNVAHPFIIKIF